MMPIDRLTRKAMEVGRRQADEVLQFRAKELRRRTRAVRAAVGETVRATEAEAARAVAPALLRAAGGPGSAGTLVAEGDSWFDYPFHDILRLLEDRYGYDVESVAHKGDRVEDMAYGSGQLEEFTRRLEKLLRGDKLPKAVLLSGGGNDVAGAEFAVLLNHAQSPIAGLNEKVIEGVIDERLHFAYVTILSAITRICQERAQRRIPILIHGYAHPVPDGRGVLGGWWLLPGPWLEPGFREKGFEMKGEAGFKACTAMAAQLIDRFNTMLQNLAALPDFAHVTYIDLRPMLSSRKADYKKDWANELHPTRAGFEKVTKRFADTIAALP